LRVPPANQYRLTKYDPSLRDSTGAFTGDDWTSVSDIGETFDGVRLTLPAYLDIEARHLQVIASFLEESAVTAVIAQGVENAKGQFPIKEGEAFSPIQAIEVVRAMLRDEVWCLLQDGERFYIHVGWDYYLYVGSDRPCERSVKLAKQLGLFINQPFESPHIERN
jgi:hypothetical protein